MSGTPPKPASAPSWSWVGVMLVAVLTLAGCASAPPQANAPLSSPPVSSPPVSSPPVSSNSPAAHPVRNDIALYALSLLDTAYSWGGRGPATGFDCSGLVSHVYREAAGLKLGGSSFTLAQMSRRIAPEQKQPGDLVFFNTLGSPHSHVGVYIGNGRFVHASNPRTGVRVDLLSNRYYAQRFEGVHTLLD